MSHRAIGVIDGIVFLATWSIVGIMMAYKLRGAIVVIFCILIPISALVSWRGATLSKINLRGLGTLRLFTVDGAMRGLIASLIFIIWSISSKVFAAGNAQDGANLFSKQVGIYLA